jgi:DNA-directed RNA polymerase subunit L
MEIKILKKDKNEIEFQIESLTIAEILRVYLNKDSAVEFAAWRREQVTEHPLMKVKTSGKDVSKAVDDAVKACVSDLESLEKDFKIIK